MRRSIFASALTILACTAALSTASGADLEMIDIPAATGSLASAYKAVPSTPIRLVPERQPPAKKPGTAAIENKVTVDYRPLELLRPSTSSAPALAAISASSTNTMASTSPSITQSPASALVDEARARRMIVAAGYFGIQELYQDESGNWQALAMPIGAGHATAISIDRVGNLKSRPTLTALGQQTASR